MKYAIYCIVCRGIIFDQSKLCSAATTLTFLTYLCRDMRLHKIYCQSASYKGRVIRKQEFVFLAASKGHFTSDSQCGDCLCRYYQKRHFSLWIFNITFGKMTKSQKPILLKSIFRAGCHFCSWICSFLFVSMNELYIRFDESFIFLWWNISYLNVLLVWDFYKLHAFLGILFLVIYTFCNTQSIHDWLVRSTY